VTTTVETFRAFRVFDENGKVHGRVVDAALSELPPGDVLIKAAYSSVNYKDALAATGAGKIIRRFPLVGGIDVSGTVASSSDSRFGDGDQVLVTGYDLGVPHDGGYAEYVRVPADWVVVSRTGSACSTRWRSAPPGLRRRCRLSSSNGTALRRRTVRSS
jgi:NADPH2:quinone reductase